MNKLFISIFILLTVFAATSHAQTYVRGYYRSNGTYVAPHTRSAPDSNPYNNLEPARTSVPSYGAPAAQPYPSLGYDEGTGSNPRSVRVRGYTSDDGAYVAPHYRSAPDRSETNNWSTRGNLNPYTGDAGTERTGSDTLYPSGPTSHHRSGSLFD